MRRQCDVIVLGGGTAGETAALEAARAGARTLLVDPFDVAAGAARCGAIPLAVLRDFALRHRVEASRHAPVRDLLKTSRRRGAEQAVRRLNTLKHARARVERGVAWIEAPGRVHVEGRGTWQADTIIVATGSRPRRPARLGIDDEFVFDCESLLRTRRRIRSVVVLGAEEEGCEFACVLAALGVQVTLIERRRKLFRLGDREFLQHLHAGLQGVGVTVVNEEDFSSVEVVGAGNDRHVRVRLESGRSEVCDAMLAVAGREPRVPVVRASEGLATDDRGFVRVDENGQTSCPGIYAVGDVTGPPFRIGTAVHRALAVVSYALHGVSLSPAELPIAVNTIPQIAAVGVGEDAARLLGMSTLVGVATEEDLAVRGMSYDPMQLLKLVFEQRTRGLIGVQIAGGAASELIHLGGVFLARCSTPEEIASQIFSHPSQADAYRVAALAALRSWSMGSATAGIGASCGGQG
jgi:NAD(P) transhydrogenase